MSDEARDKALQDAIEAAGGVGALAEAIGISQAAVSQWKKVPPLQVLVVERVSKISRQRLRPDIYPPDEKRSSRSAAE